MADEIVVPTNVAAYVPNADQAFSLIRQAVTIAGAYAVAQGWLAGDYAPVVIGVAATLVSLFFSLWTNAANPADQVFAAARSIMMALGGFAVGHGWITEQMLGMILVVSSSALSMWFYRKLPGPDLPGTTLADATAQGEPAVIAGTQEGVTLLEKTP